MHHATPLIATIVAGLSLAFTFGTIANRLRLPVLLGYLIAGIVVGPFTPGFVADQSLAPELAEIGVILLMFGVGLHFSLKDLLSVRAIAVPGAMVQIAVATALGWGLATIEGWPAAGGLVFGLSLSVASTVVLLRALQERRVIDTSRGRIAVGWLIVEDLAMVLALVLLPPIGAMLNVATESGRSGLDAGGFVAALGITLAKVTAFVVLMLLVGRRAIPWLLHYVAHTGSRELFRLGVLAIGLGVAYGAAQLFDVSFALGAFFAGMVLAESELSHRAAEESLPLRDAFAVLFFVSVGMLFNPAILWTSPGPLAATLLIIMVGKSLAAFAIVRAFGHGAPTAGLIAASLAQIGEFSFILGAMGVELGFLPAEGRDLIITGAMLSIALNPLVFLTADRLWPRERAQVSQPGTLAAGPLPPTALTDHIVLVGFGRVGSIVGAELAALGRPLLVIEDDNRRFDGLKKLGVETIAGNGVLPMVLHAANVAGARNLIVAIPDGFEAGALVLQARQINPHIRIVARAHSDAEVEYLVDQGADHVIMGEKEIAQGMVAYAISEVSSESRRAPRAVETQDWRATPSRG